MPRSTRCCPAPRPPGWRRRPWPFPWPCRLRCHRWGVRPRPQAPPARGPVPPTSPPAPAAPPPPPPPPARAGAPGAPPALWRRMACWLYEGLLMFAVVFIAGYLFGTLSQTRNALDNRHALQAFVCLVAGIYFTWFWARGQTLAQKTWHLRVVDKTGRAVTEARALLRYLLCWLWFLPPLAAMAPFSLSAGAAAVIVSGWVALWALLSRFHPQRQFWHDALAGTPLVHVDRPPKYRHTQPTSPPPPPPPAPPPPPPPPRRPRQRAKTMRRTMRRTTRKRPARACAASGMLRA